ncbi:dihydroflavonol-4-reductase [Kitasatospora sp. MAA4]|uniref:NAD-dependent epimerase/dehydratase family protein n=1 Tax=Kitasatospora sp. MAA4 TaxID=3035093 RepID=UPI002475C0EF|nr:NAD-dependent epimerase/dehydratase family protein [Kitasatospora sp. MAA4]MDH6133525.1 dihydroflavonol-4-reductase [Kitasatospora sp. MAA4]
MKAFVTGGTGLLGGNLVRLLRDQGHPTTVLVRDRSRAEQVLGGTGAELVEGDLLDVGRYASALEGCDVLFHTAAYFRETFQPGAHHEQLQAVNVDGTVALLEAADQAGVRRAVHVSSAGVIGHRPGGGPADESVPPGAAVLRDPYLHSKVRAEQAVDRFRRDHRLPVVVVQPSWMFGPYDTAPSSSGRLVRNFLRRGIPAVLPGGGKVADARDVAQAMLAAAERGRSGERYIVGGPYVPLAKLLATLQEVSGVPAPTRRAPYPAALAVAWLSQSVARARRVPALVTVQSVRILRHNNPTSSDKAVRELGASFRPLEETLRDTVAWYRDTEVVTAV